MNKKTFVNYKQKNYFKYFSTICCFLIFLICCLSLFNIDKSSTNHLGLIKNEQANTICTNTNLLLTSTTTKQGAEAIDEARKCVVEIVCEGFGIKMAGSGVLIGQNKLENAIYIVTNYHIVQNANVTSIRLFNGFEINNVKIIGQDKYNDLAVLMFSNDQCQEKLHFANFRDSKKYPLLLAEEVFAIGNPLGQLGGTLTKGIISSLKREIYVDNNKMELIQTDASINNGNSGGGLFDNYGRLIGIVNAKISASGVEGLGFAIPIEQVEKSCFVLINHHINNDEYTTMTQSKTFEKTELGFRIDDMAFINKQWQIIKGIFITKIDLNSNAYQIGLRVYDKVISFKLNNNLISVEDCKKLSYEDNFFNIGDKIEIEVSREPFMENQIYKFTL